jgi:hypothetical protein
MSETVTISKFARSAAGRLLAERHGIEHRQHKVELRVTRCDPLSVWLPCDCGSELRLDRSEVDRLNELKGQTPPRAEPVEAVVTTLEHAKDALAKVNASERSKSDLIKAAKEALRGLLHMFDGGGTPIQGSLNRVYDLDDVAAFWAGLPQMLSEHAAAAAQKVEHTQTACEEVIGILREIRVAKALVDTDAPLDRKIEVARQLTLDPALRDAYDAAEATEDPEAARKFVADQAGGRLKSRRRRVKGDDTAYLGG